MKDLFRKIFTATCYIPIYLRWDGLGVFTWFPAIC